MTAITSTLSPPMPIRNLVCARQSASASDIVVVTMIRSGRLARARAEVIAVLAIDRADLPRCRIADLRLGAQPQRTRRKLPADHRFNMGMARHQRAVVMEHGNRGVVSKGQ